VGFINPTIYANPGAFNDVCLRFSSRGATNLTVLDLVEDESGLWHEGLYGCEGWGLGTPDAGKLKSVFLSLP
jgi:hypothetical protein